MNIADLLQPLSVYPVATVTADGLGSAIDLLDYEGELAIFVAVSASFLISAVGAAIKKTAQ